MWSRVRRTPCRLRSVACGLASVCSTSLRWRSTTSSVQCISYQTSCPLLTRSPLRYSKGDIYYRSIYYGVLQQVASREAFSSYFQRGLHNTISEEAALDDTEVSSYRPISNLMVLSKLVERLVERQLMTYLSFYDLLPSLQSVFRPGNSTETAVLRVLSDILLAADRGDVSAIVLLDIWRQRLTPSINRSCCSCCSQRLLPATLPIDGFSHTCPVVNSVFGVLPLGHLLPTCYAACHRDLCEDRSCLSSTE